MGNVITAFCITRKHGGVELARPRPSIKEGSITGRSHSLASSNPKNSRRMPWMGATMQPTFSWLAMNQANSFLSASIKPNRRAVSDEKFRCRYLVR
jgi:hypothetical protein